MTDLPASWQPDPSGRHDHRWWNGTAWTDNVADAGVRSKDAYSAPAPPPVTPEPVAPVAPVAPEPTVVSPSVRWDDDTAASAPAAAAPTAPPTRRGRGKLVVGGLVLAAIIAVVAVLAITGDDESSTHGELVGALQDQQPGLSDHDADCVADKVIAAVGEDKVSAEARRSGRYDVEIIDAYANAANECGLTGPGGTTDPTAVPNVGSLPEIPGVDPTLDTSLTPEQRLEYYEQTLKIPHDQAVCLRDAWVRAAEAGTAPSLTDLLDPCGVSIEDITRAISGG